MIIAPEVFVTPDRPVVRFREPREKVNLEDQIPKILHAQGWGIGTYFDIQFVDHDRTQLLASASYVVTEVKEGLYTSEANPYQPITKTVFMRRCERVSEWRNFGEPVTNLLREDVAAPDESALKQGQAAKRALTK